MNSDHALSQTHFLKWSLMNVSVTLKPLNSLINHISLQWTKMTNNPTNIARFTKLTHGICDTTISFLDNTLPFLFTNICLLLGRVISSDNSIVWINFWIKMYNRSIDPKNVRSNFSSSWTRSQITLLFDDFAKLQTTSNVFLT